MYIDTEAFTIAYLQSLSPGNVRAEMPNEPAFPFYLVTRVAGGDDGITDHAVVDVATFHSTRDLSRKAARQMHNRMLQLSPKTVVTVEGSPVSVDRSYTIHGPIYSDYMDENLKRYVARYQVPSRVTASPL